MEKIQFENNKNNFIVTGYTTQQNVGEVWYNDKQFMYLHVFQQDGEVITFYFDKKDSHILNPLINYPSILRRYDQVIGIGKVKGLCVVFGTEINNKEVIIHEVKFVPRFIPKDVLILMNRSMTNPNNEKEVKEIQSKKFMMNYPTT